MEKYIQLIENKDYEAFVSGIEALTCFSSEISDLSLEKVVPILKSKLTDSPNSVKLILSFFAKLSNQDSFSLHLPKILPELITLFANSSKSLSSSIFSLLRSFSLKNDLSPYLIQNGLNNRNFDVKASTIKLIKELYKSQKAPDLLIKTLKIMSLEPTEILKNLASEALESIFKPESENFDFLKDFQFCEIPQKIVEKVFSLNSNEKYANLQLLQEIIRSMDSLKSLPILSLLHILGKALEDTNFRISLISLDLVYYVLSSPSISIPESSIKNILPFCIKKLGDNKISVRQSAHKLFRLLLRINILEVIPELLLSLESPNWHIREESLSVLIVSMLAFTSYYDYGSLTLYFAKLLDDSRTKIRVTSTEALAVLNSIYGKDIVLDKLKEIVDEKAFESIIQRFKQKNLPILTDEYITFSKSHSKPFETISTSYFFPSSLKTHKIPSVSCNRVIGDTPTSAETSTEQNYIRKSLSSINHNKNLIGNFRIQGSLPQTAKDNPSYIPFNELEPLVNPSESLQKCIFYSENWLEHFETVNIIRKLVKYNPEVFISKVTLHNIMLNLLKWADSLRSSLSKNALIALKEICEHSGKIIDGEIPNILKIFLKKASDTNTFIAETAAEGLNALCLNCNQSKVLSQLVNTAENVRNPAIKAKTMNCIGKIIENSKTGLQKMKDISKAIMIITDFMSDASLEVRLAATKAFDLLVDQKTEKFLDFLSSLDLKETAFRKVKDAIRRKTNPLSFSSTKKDLKVVLPSISSRTLKKDKTISASAKELLTTNFVEENLAVIENLEKNILDAEWKNRYYAIKNASELVVRNYNSVLSAHKAWNIVEILKKGLSDSNLKVLIHSLKWVVKVIPVFNKDIEKYLSIVEGLVVALGCSNRSIRDAAWDACILIILHADNDLLVPFFAENFGKTSLRGKAAVLTLLINVVSAVKDKKMLEDLVLPISLKNIDAIRTDIRNEAGRLVVLLYKILGNTMLDHIPTNKMQKVINIITNKYE